MGRALVSDARLVVFPPGTSDGERRWLRLRRAWPTGGAALAVVTAALLAWTPSAVAALVAVALYGAGFAVVRSRTRRLRPLLRTVRTSTVLGGDAPEVAGDVVLQTTTLDYLCALEAALRDGVISPAEFEQGWATAWSAIPAH